MSETKYLLNEKNYLFTSESVSEGHPDKVADQISDAILDEFLAHDHHSKVACETLVTTGQVVVAGEVKSEAVDVSCCHERAHFLISHSPKEKGNTQRPVICKPVQGVRLQA